LEPVPEAVAVDKVAQTYGRIKEMFGGDVLPEPFLIYGRVPAFLSDFYMNFKKFCYSEGKLDLKQKTVIALAVSNHANSEHWIRFFTERARQLGLDEQAVADVAAVGATCAMYNVFFKFRDISGSDVFSGMGVGLRAHTFTQTSLDAQTVELINIAISDINGCKPCTAGHVAEARKLGLSDDAILETIQCAATMLAGTQFLKSAGY
jgi:alkyl hydroperoxide reductase subunit D